jgi:tRNA-Thr(GGU) m(6)t(6)A37 methyltransferase TsaA
MTEVTAVIQLEPIGVVRNAVLQSHRDTRWEEIESEILVDEKWRDALDGIDQFSHLWIVFYLDRMTPPETLHIRPLRHSDLPLVGIFATRSPQRPNPIGICAVQLVDVRGNVLRVRGLDAFDGTPVLDIKPYLSRGDAIENARVGEWVEKYWAESFGT